MTDDATAGMSGPDRLAGLIEAIDGELLAAAGVSDGDAVLDLATGSGTLALKAAKLGADVTGIDSDEPLLEKARFDAEDAGVGVIYDEGNVEYLPYDDSAFDVLVSNFGLVWAPDHANVALELARVARPGARLAFTAWKPNPKLGELYRTFTEEPVDGREAYEWGREDHVEDMLGEDWELEYQDGTVWIDAASGEELWSIFSQASPPIQSVLARLDESRAEEFHRAFVELYEEYRSGEGIRAPRRYLLVSGRRR